MSKRKQLSGGVERRTQGSAYDEDNALRLGQDFLAELETPPPNPELEAENETLRQELAEYEQRAIVRRDDGTLEFRGLKMSAKGVDENDIPDDLDEQEWITAVGQLRVVGEALQWAVGDLVNHAAKKWGDKYEYYARETGYTEKTLREYAYVARSVHLSIRMDKLSFGHHQLVAGFKDETGRPVQRLQEQWLQTAQENNWSVAALRKAIAEERRNNRQLPARALNPREAPKLSRLQKMGRKAARGNREAFERFLNDVEAVRKWLEATENEITQLYHQNRDD